MYVDIEILEQFIQSVKNDVIAAQKAAGRVGTGKSINLYETEVKRIGPLTSVILYGPEYFYYINNGRDAGGFPPVQNIRIWAEAKGIIESSLKEYQKNSIAYAIAKKIAERGTSNRDPVLLEQVTEQRVNVMVSALFASMEEDITKQVKLTFG